eukprot:gene22741-28899_t
MTPLPAFGNWHDLCCSQNGQYVTTVQTNNGYVFVSTDFGASWDQAQSAPQTNWTAITCNHIGQIQTAAVTGGKMHLSADFGVTWRVAPSSPTLQWGALAGDATGQRLLAAAVVTTANNTSGEQTSRGAVYQSVDFGSTWVETSDPAEGGEVGRWSAVTSDNAGLVFAASSYGGQIYYSICDDGE